MRNMAQKQTNPPNENPIEKIATSVYPAFALLAGMKLDLFTPLKKGPMEAEQIASAIGVSSTKLNALLYALVVAGLLKVEGNKFSNSDIADTYLVNGSPSCVLDIHELLSTMWGAALRTCDSIKTGLPQAKLDYAKMQQDELAQFFRGEHPYAVECGNDFVKRFNFSSYKNLLDVGGGSGGLSIAVAEACPNIQATVLDLPVVTPITQQYIDESDTKERINVESGDVVREQIQGSYDVAVMTAFLQVLSPEDDRRAINNISKVIIPGGDVYIRGYGIIDNSRVSPEKLVGFNLVYINVYDEGQAYTEQEHRDWLEESGFGLFKRTTLSDGSSIISARKRI